ncbi:uncharacterized protein LOC122380886 [Amphibalanus amphitrite]|uniref:uncharacterized protein LOC122380886 n=1 Tax=Amphibalanus amphitrite TaxID=1232801 RepID=UPI001C90A15B|nr:uncharacterized protein LOC122380886 [Amphibalanus amphitrite]
MIWRSCVGTCVCVMRVVGSSVAVRRPPRGPGAPARGPSDRDRLSARAAHPTPADGQREMQGAPGPLLLPLLVLLLALLVAGVRGKKCGTTDLRCSQICSGTGNAATCSCLPGWRLEDDKQKCTVATTALCYEVRSDFFVQHPAEASRNQSELSCQEFCSKRKAHYSALGRMGCRCLEFFEVVGSLGALTYQPAMCDGTHPIAWSVKYLADPAVAEHFNSPDRRLPADLYSITHDLDSLRGDSTMGRRREMMQHGLSHHHGHTGAGGRTAGRPPVAALLAATLGTLALTAVRL